VKAGKVEFEGAVNLEWHTTLCAVGIRDCDSGCHIYHMPPLLS